jgi:uncharacterized protein
VIRSLLYSLLYFPSRALVETPEGAGLDHRELVLETDDGERLHGWWIGARTDSLGHLVLCHGNAGNVGDRVLHADLLTAAGFDVLLFDYRGYGRSSGRPSEEGTYRDACAALACLLEQPGVDPARVFYLGESLGGAVACPGGPRPRRLPGPASHCRLHSPLLILHGERDDIVPLAQGRALFEAAPGPKRMHVFPGLGHNDLVLLGGADFAGVIASWAGRLHSPSVAD